MSEVSPLGSPDCSLLVKPLPWTNPGPNEHSNLRQPTANSSVADLTFKLKGRVIDMKQLEALKKRLPPGIDIRITSNNTIKFRKTQIRLPIQFDASALEALQQYWGRYHKSASASARLPSQIVEVIAVVNRFIA